MVAKENFRRTFLEVPRFGQQSFEWPSFEWPSFSRGSTRAVSRLLNAKNYLPFESNSLRFTVPSGLLSQFQVTWSKLRDQS